MIKSKKLVLNYKLLCHLLIEKDMNKDSYVDIKSIEKIYISLDCRIENVVEILSYEQEEK